MSPRPPPKISYKDTLMCDLDSDVAGSSKDYQRIQSNPKTQLSSTVRPVCVQESTKEIEKRTMFDHDDVTDSTSTVRPVCGSESTKCCVLTPTHVEEDQTSTGRPVIWWSKKRSTKLLSEYQDCHTAVVKGSRTSPRSRACEKRSKIILVEKLFMPTCRRITSTIHSAKIRKRWSANWAMWSYSSCAKLFQTYNVITVFFIGIQEIVYCTCGQCLIYSESRRKFNKLRLDALTIPNFVIKKGPNHFARHGKTQEQTEYHMAWNAWKRCCKKVDSQGEHFKTIHDRFLRDPVYRESQLAVGWTEQKCKECDELAQEDHTYRLTREEKKRYQGQWYLTLNKAGKNGPMKLRTDFRAAVSMENRLHHESGERGEEPIHPDQYNRWHPSSVNSTPHTSFFSCSEHALIVAQHTAWIKNVLVRDSCHLHGHPRCAVLRSLTLCSSLCSFPCVSPVFFFYLNLELNLFLHVAVIGGSIPLALRQLRSLVPWPQTPLSQVTSPASLTTSTTQRLLKSSSRSNPATRCPRTCLTRNSTMRPSAKALSSPLFIHERGESAERSRDSETRVSSR